ESDSMAMDEVAVDRVLHGHAIYGTDWSGTQVDGYAYEYGGIDLHYYAHFPLMVLSAVPVRIGADLLDVPFDYRFVVIAFSLLADPGAFYRDIVAFPTGILPMGGLGFTALLVFLRAVPIDARFPLAPFELAAMVPALWFGMRAFGRGRTLGHLLFGYTLTLFA